MRDSFYAGINELTWLTRVEKLYAVSLCGEVSDANFWWRQIVALLSYKRIARELAGEQIVESGEQILSRCSMYDIRWVTIRDSRYPRHLRCTVEPPIILYYRGSLPPTSRRIFGVVGTRKPSNVGRRAAYQLGFDAARSGFGVVSGLAYGIDSASQKGCVDGGGKSWAVLGSGVDCITPMACRPIARRLLELGGGILSEYSPGSIPAKWQFVERNRIIAWLTRLTCLVESPKRSGANYTAAFAVDGGRELVVHSAPMQLGIQNEGAQSYAASGAVMVNSFAEVKAVLSDLPPIDEETKQEYE
jgi:DNA processing protein